MQEPIRILMLFTILNRGGAETMIMNYYRNMDRTKVQFDFMVHREERGAYEDEIEAMGGRIYRMLPVHPLNFRLYRKQISRFFDEHPEYRIIHGHCSELGYFIYKEAYKRKIPVIIAHAHLPQAFFDIKWPFRMFFKQRLRKFVNGHFACGRSSAIWLFGKTLGEKATIQRNAIDTDRFVYSEERRRQIRAELNITDNTIVWGHIGRFDKQKNHSFLINLFKEYTKQSPDSLLLLVGDGEWSASIQSDIRKKKLEKQTMLLGVREDIPNLLQAMDVFVFPSYYEGLGVALIEAQSTSLPCIVSDRIPQEAFVTDLIVSKKLTEPKSEWIHSINRALGIRRTSEYANRVRKGYYSIKENAEWLQSYYLEQWERHQ